MFVLILTDQPIDDPLKLCLEVETAAGWLHPVEDGWIVMVEPAPPDDSRDPRARNRARQARFRDKKRVTRNADTVTRNAVDNASGSAECNTHGPFRALSECYSESSNAETAATGSGVTRYAVTRETVTRNAAAEDVADLDDDQCARGKRGVADVRALLDGRGSE